MLCILSGVCSPTRRVRIVHIPWSGLIGGHLARRVQPKLGPSKVRIRVVTDWRTKKRDGGKFVEMRWCCSAGGPPPKQRDLRVGAGVRGC